MDKVLLVSGCSMTHGSETFNNFYHPENIKNSYSQHLANKLNVRLKNLAIPRASNEYIFHSILKELYTTDNIHSIIVCWTTLGRLCWKCNGRYYFFGSQSVSSMEDILAFSTEQELMHQEFDNDVWITSDSQDMINHLKSVYKFFITDHFDEQEEELKLKDYQRTLDDICQLRNIKLTQLTWDDLDVGSWWKEQRHPTKDEHKQIADKLYSKHYEN
jgi:hypothetical protein